MSVKLNSEWHSQKTFDSAESSGCFRVQALEPTPLDGSCGGGCTAASTSHGREARAAKSQKQVLVDHGRYRDHAASLFASNDMI